MKEYANPQVKKAIDAIKTVGGFFVPDEFPVPTADGVIIDKVATKEEMTVGGIIMPASVITNSNVGVIMAVGPDCPEYYRPGLKIMHATNGGNAIGTAIIYKGSNYFICSKYDIIAIMPLSALSLAEELTSDEKRKEKQLAQNAKVLKQTKVD